MAVTEQVKAIKKEAARLYRVFERSGLESDRQLFCVAQKEVMRVTMRGNRGRTSQAGKRQHAERIAAGWR